jgi:aspartyl-tRNA(Asn)/glutamyl-tRNA(Gln) amidotransferase subunit B
VSESAASRYETVIGLEVHAQLLTASKLFAPDPNHFGDAPNQNVSVITLAHPGTLPKLNRRAVELAVRFGLATNARIAERSYFDRKNYFYPDLPKGYQVSQDRAPICLGGEVRITLKDGAERTIPLHHTHLEEDAGKSIHEGEQPDTLLDYNRAGTPLIEIVSEPALRSAEEAGAYLTEIRNLVRALDICDGNMEEGSLRCDANVSVRFRGETRLGTRTEIKNMNSVRYLQRAIEYEAARQIEVLESGGTITQETRNFSPETGQTSAMRAKETLNDYRYFPEPDLPPVVLSEADIARIRAAMPPLPRAERARLQTTYGLSGYDAAFFNGIPHDDSFFRGNRPLGYPRKGRGQLADGPGAVLA